MRDRDAIAPRARRETAGDRDGALGGHVRHIRILAGGCDFAEDEERTVGLDLHGDGGIPDKTVAQASADFRSQPRRRAAARGNRTDQGHGDRAAGIDRVGVGQAFLAVDHDAQLVAGIQMIGAIVTNRHRRNVSDRRGSGGSIDHGTGRSSEGGTKRADGAAAGIDDDLRRRRDGRAIGDGIEIGPRRNRNRRGRAHAARQSERSRSGDDRQSKRARNTHLSHPSNETALVLHLLWLTNGFWRGRRVMPGLVPGSQVLTATSARKAWMAGSSPAMTGTASAITHSRRHRSGTTRRCRQDRNSRPDSWRDIADGNPRRNRTGPTARSRW